MRYISHRGNLTGANKNDENTIPYIAAAVEKGFEVEIDLWRVKNRWFLGHDNPEIEIDDNYLIAHRFLFWIHCKNREALSGVRNLSVYDAPLHYFWHQEDQYAMTSNGWVISYPGRDACLPRAVCMCPEQFLLQDQISQYLIDQGFHAVCSDYIETLANLNT